MKKQLIILFLVQLALFSACNTNESEDGSTNDSSPSLTISTQDSIYVVAINNYRLNGKEATSWTLDGTPIKIKQLPEGQYYINTNEIKAGKHTVSLIQGATSLQGTIYKINNIGYSIAKIIPHRSDLFTEGFFFDEKDNLWESSGLEGRSKILKMRWRIDKWQIIDSINEKPEEFGEGISILNGELVHLYWKNQYLKTFTLSPLKQNTSIPFEGEGWGLCSAGNEALWVSNGSSQLRKIQINDNQLLTLKTINVTNNVGPVINLNELEEMTDKYIWANIWQSDHIILIDQSNGTVLADLDLSTLSMEERNLKVNAEVLNGIAWHKQDRTLWVTGKYWKNIYILKLTNLP